MERGSLTLARLREVWIISTALVLSMIDGNLIHE